METQKVQTCFTITFTEDQYQRARAYIDDMKKHPKRVFWAGKEGKSDDALVIEQIAHRILMNGAVAVAQQQILKHLQ